MDKQDELACGSCGYTADPDCEICSPERPKQDELAAALRKAGQESSGHCPASEIDWDAIAAAVRSFMGSDEAVDAALDGVEQWAKDHRPDFFSTDKEWRTIGEQKPDELAIIRGMFRAALSAALRNPDA